VAAEILAADPAASLAEIAGAAGISRTTLHKHYATRDELIRAVGHRALDLWQRAVESAACADDPDGGLRAITAALIPIGPQITFLWRTPVLDRVEEIQDRMAAVEEPSVAVLRRARDRGVLAPGVPDWWLIQTFYSLVFAGSEAVRAGRLAPLEAPGRVLGVFLHGTGAPGRDQPGRD
jgi:AcrR family transcriptional regulator